MQPLVCCTAINTGFAPGGLMRSDVYAAVAAGQHLNRAVGCIGSGITALGRAVRSPLPNYEQSDQQDQQILHAARPKITSRTKREPT